MTRDPRAQWTGPEFAGFHPAAAAIQSSGAKRGLRAWLFGANDRLAALLPQLEAADALADWVGKQVARSHRETHAALVAYLAARDAHLTEGTPDG